MLDPDISTEDARRLLSSPAFETERPGPLGWTRRRFLQAVGAGAFGAATIGNIATDFFGGSIPTAWAGSPIGPADGILIVITLYGGNDGLNTFVPFGDSNYYAKRPNLAIKAADVLRVNDSVGFAPQLSYLKALYDAGEVAAIQGVGYANPNLSHFTSTAIWQNGSLSGQAGSGWLGRWLDGQPAATADLAGTSLDSTVPLLMQGFNRRAAGISPYGGVFGTDTGASDLRVFGALRAMAAASAGRGTLHDTFTGTIRRELDLANDVGPAFKAALPGGGDLTRKLTMAARLLNINIGLRVLDVSRGGLDNHDNEAGQLPGVLGDLNTGLQAFFATLNPSLRDRVTIMTVSEFGRTVKSNDSGGTDHGTANTSFVIGSNVRGGLYGQMPSLVNLDSNGRMLPQVDFRSMYATLLDGWLGGAGSIVNGPYENLNLFYGAPGSASPTSTPIVLGPSASSGFVPMTPLRIFDTRDGTGGRNTPLGAGETWSVGQAGQFGIPIDATAVAWNLTAVDATVATYVTVWPGGTTMPASSNLNPVPGLAVPNLVVGQLGPGGALSIFNNGGTVQLVADLVGYFSTSSNLRLQALAPSRLLDTRDGTGDHLGAIGPGEIITLKVTERGGIPNGATAVALNVTATGPTDASYLTVWPSNDKQPLASSVNMVTGQTVPNMVFAGVSADGNINIFNNNGHSHVIVDVLGSFSGNSPGRYVALQPGRVLDTRNGTGAPSAPIGQTPLILKLSGQSGVPNSGVSAVLLNVTVVAPSNDTYVTVFPSGSTVPLASNLNAVAGQIVPNSVLARLGPDGSVALYNNAGTVDLLADVMGYFTT